MGIEKIKKRESRIRISKSRKKNIKIKKLNDLKMRRWKKVEFFHLQVEKIHLFIKEGEQQKKVCALKIGIRLKQKKF